MSGNRPPADELHWVRAERKRLKDREEELKLLMLNDPAARTGNYYAVKLKTVKTSRTDYTEMKARYPEIFSEYSLPFTQTHVELWGINEDGELVSLRRKETSDE